MIGASTIMAVCITLFITLILPLIIYIVYGIKSKNKIVWLAWLAGAAGFFVTQIIVRMPVMSVIQLALGYEAYMGFVENNYILYCFILALTAALFEFAGRFVVAKLLQKNTSFTCGFAAGLGHGSIEAMVIVGMTYVNNLLYIIMINTGVFDTIVAQAAATGADVSALVALPETFMTTPAAIFYLGGFERVLTVIGHIAMSLIVCYFVWNKQALKGSLICIAWHFALDFITPLLSSLATPYLGNKISTNMSYVLCYSFLSVMTVVAVVVILKLRKNWKTA